MPEPCLIVAHPGHELRLFGWMEQQRPLVCVLTDGAGQAAPPRTAFSRTLIQACGARAGAVMGPLSDRAWYAALLAGDASPFLAAAETIAGQAEPGALVVADPVEGYNPMHDLCAAVADRVAALVGGARATYPLTRVAQGGDILALDDATQARKRTGVANYTPLAQEASVVLGTDPQAMAEERILPAQDDWPETPDEQPGYEAIGANRQAAGVYDRLITYREHVRPMALILRRL
ncbi:hypothetical protein ACQW02_17910 [Humitalea sp. 24SJ18S-53]|uniref:hypothetical protein n=1 Tax=Humitalea sp. 24SJ18S-53 TaxID=3422307 RepID=UPI003D66ADA3